MVIGLNHKNKGSNDNSEPRESDTFGHLLADSPGKAKSTR